MFVGGPLDRQTRSLWHRQQLVDVDGAIYTVLAVDTSSPKRSELIAAGYPPAWAYAILRDPT